MHTLLLLAEIMDRMFLVYLKDLLQLVESSSRQSLNKTSKLPMKAKKGYRKQFLIQSSTTGEHCKQIFEHLRT